MATKSSTAAANKTAPAATNAVKPTGGQDPALDAPAVPAANQRELVNASPFDALLSKMFRNTPTTEQLTALTNFLEYSGYLGLVQVAKSLSTVETILKTLLEKGGQALSNDVVTLFTWRTENQVSDEYTTENLGQFFELMETLLAKGYEEYVQEQIAAGKMLEAEMPEHYGFSIPRWNGVQSRFVTQGLPMDSGKIRFASVWLNRRFGVKGNNQLPQANAARREKRAQQD